MKAYELANILESNYSDTEVYIETPDGVLHQFKVVERPETFDGFDTVYEGGFNLVMID